MIRMSLTGMSSSSVSSNRIDLNNVDQELKSKIKKFVDSIFTASDSISLEMKAEFGELVRQPETRLLFAMFVDEHRVNSKRVSELTYYSLVQYFSIVLLECLLAEDYRPARILTTLAFTFYMQNDRLPSTETQNDTSFAGERIYLYSSSLKELEIFKSIRYWTSAFFESVISERNNHPVFVDREQGKLSNEKRIEELDCSRNITFGLLGSFIHNMCLLDLSHEFCQEFLDKHATIADLSEDMVSQLRSNLRTMFTLDRSKMVPVSASEKLATFLHNLSNRLNNSSIATTSSTQAQQYR